MITVERLCKCGGRLYAKATDEDDARRKVQEFLRVHTGRESDGTVHERLKPWQYWPMMRAREAAQRAAAMLEAKQIQASPAPGAARVRRYTLRKG